MQRYDRQRWRAACLLRRQLIARRRHDIDGWVQAAALPLNYLTRLNSFRGRLRHAQQRELDELADRSRSQLTLGLSDLRTTLDVALNQLRRPLTMLPSLRDLMAEMQSVEDEFGNLKVERQHRQLVVHTEPIELEDVYLGPFAIKLEMGELGRSDGQCYAIAALDPHPAAAQSSVTHPHVSHERLCAGEATAAIGRALSAGRLADFFVLVRSVLTTYNDQSPYVSLDEWNGIGCYDCGTSVSEDDASSCQQCDERFCDSCCGSCQHCSDSICDSCMSSCQICDDRSCQYCLKPCRNCNRRTCPDCLEDELCTTCDRKRREQEDEQEEENQEEQDDEQTLDTAPATTGADQDVR